ncbi:MAG: sigma factor-like helix-turn-helix DNA-binding protein [bacterium]|nr:sigma factor-like helix-turn-helix DNA-binding protein [bacterium]
MISLKHKPKQVVKKFLAVLPDRAREVVSGRFGLGAVPDRLTLEAIGKKYGITRERVRQIESYALSGIRKSDLFKKEQGIFEELKEIVSKLGGIIAEEDVLSALSKDKSGQNHIHLLLVLGDAFSRAKEDDDFKHRWHVDEKLSEKVHSALRKLYKGLNREDLVSELDIIAAFLGHVEELEDHYKNEDVVKRWLSISKKIGKNKLGEWGLLESPNITAKGVRDYAFLVIRKHGSPIHFREVARSIEKMFGKKAHVATTHNELIKDKRFVLVGRGLYALAEWGYMSGVVKDVIKGLLEKHGPMSKQEIVEKVMKERYVKENTIVVNLQNPTYFKKDKEGKYIMVA